MLNDFAPYFRRQTRRVGRHCPFREAVSFHKSTFESMRWIRSLEFPTRRKWLEPEILSTH
jgi:hypothetical protein